MANKFSNRLINESSPYLRQHAHNPVDWFPWGEEALQKAKDLDIPILVSIGYSACHWCHVMEHESFEDEVTARYMNEHFVNIKIDREERPDLDHIYMDAVQAIAGNGGWPLNVFLTPDAKPFYGGTYFPPQKAFNRPSWIEILNFISKLWNEKKDEVLTQANILTEHIQSSSNQMIGALIPSLQGGASFTEADCNAIAINALAKADKEDGGFGAAPKFPQTFTIQYLLMFGYFFNHKESLDHAIHSLKRMLNGGIYDHLAGGMARYSTDKEWLAPHFEKMLYDNALLVNALCDAYQITKDSEIVNGIHKTLQFLIAEMKHSDGGFYAAIDADSEGEEGKYYVWDKREIQNLLKDDAEWYCRWFGVTENGNWEHKNILHIKLDMQDFARKEGLELDNLKQKIESCNQVLLQHRNQRIRPSTDDKILLGWNALLITAFSKAFASTQNDGYRNEAVQLETFIDAKFAAKSGAFYHTYKDAIATQPGFLDDYAYLIQAYIHLYEMTFETTYLEKAIKVTNYVIENFSGSDNTPFYYTHKDQKDAIVRKSEIYDGAVPSGNSIMAENLFYLSVIFDNRQFMNRAAGMVISLKEVIIKYPTSFAIWATLVLKQVVGPAEIVITGEKIQEVGAQIRDIYLPVRVLMGSVKPLQYPLLLNKGFENKTWIYLCRQYACSQPVNTIGDLKKQINKEYLNKSVRNN